MSKPDRAKSCWGKVAHHKRRDAATEAARLRRLGGGYVHAYRCDNCGEFHVGHPIGSSVNAYHAEHGQVA